MSHMSDVSKSNLGPLSAERMSTKPRTHTWYVQVKHCRWVDYQEAVNGATKFLSVLWQVADPVCTVTFDVHVARGESTTGFTVTSWESRRARRLAGGHR
jgi:hypothetical protein